jgi:hypothetical protein
MFSFPPNLEEVRSISSAPNGKYYFITHDTIGYINDNFTLCPSGTTSFFKNNHGMGLGYKCEDFRYDNAGIMAIRADANAVYVHRGNQLQKRSLTTGAILATVAIPGGGFNSVFLGGNQVTNSGIDIDNCGNIYVGSQTGVYKFNSNLVQQAFYATAFRVYDVEVNSGGEIIACGGTGNSTNTTRSGGVQTFAATACAPIATTCCDATVCIPQDVCVTDSPITLTAATAGGTWSGTGVSAAGVFNPATAGVGLETVTYTLACGSESIAINVNACANLTVCQEANGQLTVSGGSPTYTWSQGTTTTTTTTPANAAECTACGGTPQYIPFFNIYPNTVHEYSNYMDRYRHWDNTNNYHLSNSDHRWQRNSPCFVKCGWNSSMQHQSLSNNKREFYYNPCFVFRGYKWSCNCNSNRRSSELHVYMDTGRIVRGNAKCT